MAGSVRFDPSSASPENLAFGGGFLTGPRGNYPGASLDRSASSREGIESRMFSSASSTPRGNATLTGNLPPLSHCLMLDPITMEDQKCTWLSESRKILGIPVGSSVEENAFGAVHSKHSPPVATEELKRFKASVLDASNKARGRAKRLDESVDKLNRYCEALNSKKQQRNEFMTNERSSGSNLLKMGALVHRNTPDLMNQRLEDRTKTVVMNRRVRSSATEIRAEGRSSMPIRQPMVMAKDRDMLRGDGSDLVEEKIRTLPAGGEAWDKKKKRKRSVGTIFSRPTDGDAELKQTLHHKANDEPGTQACDAQTFRSGPFNGGNGINKLDCNSMSGNANARVMFRSELDKASLARDFMAGLNKERLVPKGNKLNVSEDNQLLGPSPVTKAKASRAARSGPVTECNSSPSFPRTSGTLEGWEQPPSGNKNHLPSGDTNRKRPMPTGSASPPMAQWVGQRPQKISRTRRANLVSPVSNHDELQTPSEGCSPSDVGSRLISSGTNGLLHKSVAIGAQQVKIKQEIVSSPAKLSESEESGAGAAGNRESRSKEKVPGGGELDERAVNAVQNTGATMLPTKKNKMVNKEETGVGVRKQGRSGRGSSTSRASIVASREKLETPTSGKPLKNMRPNSERNGSKSGRPPLKKLSDRKAFASLGHLSSNGSPDCAGESDDDREELTAAANFACNARNFACSSPFWKKMEPIFGFSLQEAFYLKEQLISMEENDGYLSRIFGNGTNDLGDVVHKENVVSKTLVSGPKERNVQDQIQEVGILRGRVDSEGRKTVPPLYQRVLSALIMEDDTEEFEKDINDIDGRTLSIQYNGNNSPFDTCSFINVESKNRVEIQFAEETSPHTVNRCSVDRFSCNGASGFGNATGICNQLFNDDLPKGDFGLLHSDIGIYPGFSKNGVDASLHVCTNSSGISSFVHSYEKMPLEDKLLLELQSVGLYQETVPDLEDGEDGAIDQQIVGLQKLLHEQKSRHPTQTQLTMGGEAQDRFTFAVWDTVDTKKMQLKKFIKSIEEGMELEKRHREQVAMDRLVELAYRKLLATRGSMASKFGISRVPRQIANAFMKRTLARCHKFDETGKSCFNDPALQDAIFATPPYGNNGEPTKCYGLGLPPENQKCKQEPGVSGTSSLAQRDHHNNFGRSGSFESLTHPSEQEHSKTGPMLYRGKKKEVLLDDVGGCSSLKAASNLGHTLLGRAKGKRSERERDKDTPARNSGTKAGRPSLGNNKGERKTKTKPKQKTARLSTSGNGLVSNSPSATGFGELIGNSNNRKREAEPLCNNDIPEGPQETREQMDIMNLQLQELDSIEIGVANDLDGNQDLGTWLNIDDDGLQDHDVEGLDIPMDDLSDLNMLL